MDRSNTTHKGELWDMKDAAKQVGAGLPRLYTRMREKGLFTRLGMDGRNMPTRRLQEEGYFKVFNNAFWDKQNSIYRPCPKVKCTYKGLILLQEIADELAREKEKPSGERSGVPGSSDSDCRESEVVGDSTEPRTSCGTR